jgi:hypothetical protein
MGIPVNPISEFDAAFENLQELLSQLTTANRGAAKLPDGPEKTEILSAIDSAVQLSEDIFRNLQNAREKLSRRFW